MIDLLVGVGVGRRALWGNREATQLMVCQELGAQPGTLHVHGTAVKNVEGTAGHAQGRQGSILLSPLFRCVLGGNVLYGSVLRGRVLRGGGRRRLSRHRRQSQQRRQTQNQGSTRNPSVRATNRLKERGHHYPI